MSTNIGDEKLSVESSSGSPASAVTSRWRGRRIGPWGTAARAVAGVSLIAWGVAVPHEHPWLDLPGASSRALGLALGLVAVQAVLTLAVLARGRNAPRLHLGHGAACVVTLVFVIAAQFYPAAMLTAIGVPLLLLAALGTNGCELLAVPNLLLRRDDYLFCLPFSPIDAWEGRRATGTEAPSSGSTCNDGC